MLDSFTLQKEVTPLNFFRSAKDITTQAIQSFKNFIKDLFCSFFKLLWSQFKDNYKISIKPEIY